MDHLITYLSTFIYAKYKDHLKRLLWDNLFQHVDIKRTLISDFNIITNMEEKMRGELYNVNKSFGFIGLTEACGLTNLGSHGHRFTWCNHKEADARISKKLDRVMVNDKCPAIMPHSSITHIPSWDQITSHYYWKLLRDRRIISSASRFCIIG